MDETNLPGHAKVSPRYFPGRRLHVRVPLGLVKPWQTLLSVVGEEQLEETLGVPRENTQGGVETKRAIRRISYR